MLLGRVIGTVVPCVIYDGLAGVPLLIVQPLDKKQEESGSPLVCCDATRMAGPDELVYYEGGREAAAAGVHQLDGFDRGAAGTAGGGVRAWWQCEGVGGQAHHPVGETLRDGGAQLVEAPSIHRADPEPVGPTFCVLGGASCSAG